MSNEQILVAMLMYLILCGAFSILLIELEDSYKGKMFTREIKVKSPYPMVRWFLYVAIYLFTPVIFMIEMLKVGFTKDK